MGGSEQSVDAYPTRDHPAAEFFDAVSDIRPKEKESVSFVAAAFYG